MRIYWLASLLSCVVLVPLEAQSQPAPLAIEGFTLLEAGKCDSAFALWSSGWVGTDGEAKSAQLVASCRLLTPLGELAGHDVIRTVDITPRLQRIYAVLRYRTQPVYILLVAYKPTSEWQIQTVNWNTEMDRVVPPQMFGPEHPGS